jgi:Fe-S-cluster containining protein
LASLDDGPRVFFNAMSQALGETIVARRSGGEVVGALCAQAFGLFDKNVAIQSEGAPALACQGECAACCRLRVVATAPEILLIARFVEVNHDALRARGVDLPRRIAEAAAACGNLSEAQRMVARRDCPFIERGLCLAYKVRPLACRGHAAFNREACGQVAEGKNVEAAISTPHLLVRSLVQNALMRALRDANLAWGLYELNSALRISLQRPDTLDAWLAGGDPFASAAIPDFDLGEAAATFDQIAAG